jgi:hypothetical protein
MMDSVVHRFTPTILTPQTGLSLTQRNKVCFAGHEARDQFYKAQGTAAEPKTLKPGTTFDIDDEALLPGYKERSIQWGRIRPEQLVLVHVTDHLPLGGKIKSLFEATGKPRVTVHTSVNYALSKDTTGNDWTDKKIAVFMPADSAIRLNGKPAGGTESDMFWGLSLNINDPRMIVLVQDSSIPAGKLQVLPSKTIGVPSGSTVTVMGTSLPIQEAAPMLLKKMGVTPLEGGVSTWDEDFSLLKPDTLSDVNPELLTKRNAFKRFLREEGIAEQLHEGSPYQNLELSLMLLGRLDSRWQLAGVDRKSFLLQQLHSIERACHEQGRMPIDLEQVYSIVEKANTPQDAVSQISKLGITKMMGAPDVALKASAEDCNAPNKLLESPEKLLDSFIVMHTTSEGRELQKAFDAYTKTDTLEQSHLDGIAAALSAFSEENERTLESVSGFLTPEALANATRITGVFD